MDSKPDAVRSLLMQSADHNEGDEGNITLSLNEAIEMCGYGRFQRRLLLLTGATQLADAMELLLVTFLPREITCDTQFGGNLDESALSTAVFCGMLVGAFGAGRVADTLGRRAAYIATTALAGVGGVLTAAVTAPWQLVVLRFCVGAGVGGSPAALALYTEFLPRRGRGARLIGFLLLFSIGALMEVGAAWALLPSAYGWRGLVLCSALPSLLLLTAALVSPRLVPESPRFLVLAGRVGEARRLLEAALRLNLGNEAAKLPGDRLVVDDGRHPTAVDTGDNTGDTVQIRADASAKAQTRGGGESKSEGGPARPGWVMAAARSVGTLLSPALRVLSLLLCALFMLMAVVYYGVVLLTPTLVQLSGQSKTGDDPAVCVQFTNADYAGIFIANAGELPGLAAAALLLEHPRVGRRRTVALFFAACAVLLAALAGAVPPAPPASAPASAAPPAPFMPLPRAATIALLFLARSSSLGFNQSLWVLSTERFPTRVRATGVGAVTMFARIGGIVAAACIKPLYDSSRAAALLACAGACVLSVGLTWALPPPPGHQYDDRGLPSEQHTGYERIGGGGGGGGGEDLLDDVVDVVGQGAYGDDHVPVGDA